MKHHFFWERNPALLFGISLLIGTGSLSFWSIPWNWIWPTCWSLYLVLLRGWRPLLLTAFGLLYATCISPGDPTGETAYFSPSSLKPHHTPFAKGLIYRGSLIIDSQKIPCSVHYPSTKGHPKADCDYVLKGGLKNLGPADYLFQARQWIRVKNTWSLAEMRYQMKERLRKFLEEKLQKPQTAGFLGSLLSGDVESRMLRYQFGRLGLQHILAISGFHFAVLIGFCSFFLNFFLPRKWGYMAILILINIYFLFIGSAAAVQRSYLTALSFLFGKFLTRPSTGLNLLGFSLLIEVLFDPFVSSNLGFQLSFLSCIGILLFRPLFLPLSCALFPTHNASILTPLALHGYLLTSFLREALVLTLAVNAAILPLLLFHFHTFPLLSLLYNLFFPFLVGLVLFFLLISLLVHLLFPPLSPLFFGLTDFSTAQLLELSAYPPLFLNYSIHVGSFPPWIIPIYLFALFCMAVNRFFLTNTPQIR